jgi:hypothetical protein
MNDMVNKGRTSLAANHRLLIACLFASIIISTTYYYLDTRKEVYQIHWLAVSASWYIVTGFGTAKVLGKARIGYLIAGIIFWTTFAFWMIDNWYVVFGGTIIAAKPDYIMTVRNFIGAGVAALGIVSSHNAFNKTRNKTKLA